MAQISRIYTPSHEIYLWNLCYLWEVFKKCTVVRLEEINFPEKYISS